MKGYLDAKELESYKKEDLQELAKQLGVDAEGTKKEIATRCAAVEVDIPDESELTEEDKRAAEEAAAEAAAKAEEEEAATELVKVKAQRRFLDKELNQIQNAYNGFAKQNYTMLDNLKLGYGGTKEEMQRLLDDASKLSGIKYAKTGETTGKGVFTIVEVKAGQGASAGWGRLKSGAGWISLDYATRLA